MTDVETRVLAPAEGARVRHPDRPGRPLLAAEGESVAMTTYWRRRLMHGDVVELATEPAKPAKGAAA